MASVTLFTVPGDSSLALLLMATVGSSASSWRAKTAPTLETAEGLEPATAGEMAEEAIC